MPPGSHPNSFTPSPDDLPANPPGFGFERVGAVLAKMLMSRHPHAFVLGLHGPWGSGKTTLMDSIRSALGSDALIIDFNAWKYSERTALWRALILRVVESASEAGADPKAAAELRRSLYEGFSVQERGEWKLDWTALATEGVLMSMRIATAGMASGPIAMAGRWFNSLFNRKPKEDDSKLDDAAKSLDRMGSILKREVTQRAVQQVVSIEQFLEKFRTLVASPDRRIVVLIDDLDRCLPETSLDIFEAIKLFLDAPECTYVIGVDRDVIARGLAVRYAGMGPSPVDPDEYIEKTVTLSFDVPVLTSEDCRYLLTSCAADAGVSSAQIAATADVLGPNPRRLKRFARLLVLYASLRPVGEPLDHIGFKLALIAYCNSAVFARLEREPELGARLQQTVTKRLNALRAQSPDVRTINGEFATRLSIEHDAVKAAVDDVPLWRAFALEPAFGDDPTALRDALRWFRLRSETYPERSLDGGSPRGQSSRRGGAESPSV
jgi:hypothetical protein